MQIQNRETAIERRVPARAQIQRPREEHTLAAPVDVYENAEEILILADLPGVKNDAIEVHLDGTELTLEGRQEGARGATLRRSFQVPSTIDAGSVTAEMNAGVLTVRLPKRADAKPRKISVKSGG